MHTLRISLVAFMISALARGSNLASGFAPSYLHFLNLPLHILRHGRHCLPAPFKTWEYTCMWQRRQGAEGGTVDTHPEWSLITPASSSHDTYQGLQIPSCGLLRVRIRRWRSANIQRPREVSFNIELYLFKVKQERGASGTCISGLHAPSPPQTILSFRVGWCPSQTRNTPRSLCQKIWGRPTPLADSAFLWTCRKSGLLREDLITPYTSLIPPSKECFCYSGNIWEVNLFHYLTFIHNA